MDEACLYNNLSSGRGLRKEEIELLIKISMVQHLYREHNMGVRAIASALGLKQKIASDMIKDIKKVE